MRLEIYDTLKKEVVVNTSQERAFRVFTEQIDKWWHPGNHIGKAELKHVVIEPKAGGRWYEVGVDGSECDWGKVLVWEPPRRLVLAWQINADWQYDPGLITEMECNFIEEGPKVTRLKHEHRLIERYGERAQEMWSAFDSQQGWTGMLAAFAELAQQGNTF